MHGSHESGWHGDDTVLDVYLQLPEPNAEVVKVLWLPRNVVHCLTIQIPNNKTSRPPLTLLAVQPSTRSLSSSAHRLPA